MADLGVFDSLENEEQFWQGPSSLPAPPLLPLIPTLLTLLTPVSRTDDPGRIVLDGVVSRQCPTHELIDDALREWLHLAAKFRDQFLDSEDDITTCTHKLLASDLFGGNRDYVRTQIIYSLLQEDEAGPLHVISSFLLLDGRAEEATFRRMIDEACFPRLVELINGRRDDDPRLHRLLLQLVYEMSRMERLRTEDLLHVDDAFVSYLFQVIESAQDDVDDPYHYPVIRVLVSCPMALGLAECLADDPCSSS